MIITRKGSLIPRVLLDSLGQVMKFVETFVPMISRTLDWMSGSVILLMWPFQTCLSQICNGLDLNEVRNGARESGGRPSGQQKGMRDLPDRIQD